MGITHRLGVDVSTRDVAKMIKLLEKLPSTVKVENGGAYRAMPTWSQVLLSTRMDQGQLEDWLYATNHQCDYTGVFEQPSFADLEKSDV